MKSARRSNDDLQADQVYFTADLEPPPRQDDRWWWQKELHRNVTGSFAFGGSRDHWAVHIRVPSSELRRAAQQLLVAVDDANAAFDERFEPERRAREESLSAGEARQYAEADDTQAVLDAVMKEHNSLP
jgi:hypothetical protein